MKTLPPETELHRRHLEVWAEFSAWLAWQERAPFTYMNGSVKKDVDITYRPSTLRPRPAVHVTPYAKR